LKKKDDLRFFQLCLKQITLLTRSKTQWSKEITLMENPFSPPKIISNNVLPRVEVEKEELGLKLLGGILIRVELDRGLGMPEVVGARYLPPLPLFQVSVRVLA